MHLKRISAPKSWKIHRKKNVWIARPSPGPYKIEECITLNSLLIDILGYAKTKKEVNKIINEGKVLINGKIRKDNKYPLGIMDIIEIPSIKETYLLAYNKKGNFSLKPINATKDKLCQIKGKKYIKKGKTQLNFNDGRNVLVEEKEKYNVGDSVVFDLASNKIKSSLKMEKGALIYITKGSYKGNVGEVVEIKNGTLENKAKVIFKIDDKNHETLKNCVFVINKDSILTKNE